MPNLNEITPMTHTNEEKIAEEITKWLYAYNLDIPQKELNKLLETATRELPRWIKPIISNLKKSIREEIESKKDNVWGILCEMDTNIKSEKEYAGDVVDEILSLKSLE